MIDGWPDDVPFKNLSDISSSLPALESLLRKWESGKVFWKALTDAEFNKMDSERNATIENGTMSEPRPRQPRSDKGKKRTRPRVHNQGGDTSDSESDASDVNSDVHTRKHKRKSKKRHHRASDHDEDSDHPSRSRKRQTDSLSDGGREKTATGMEEALDDALQTEGN